MKKLITLSILALMLINLSCSKNESTSCQSWGDAIVSGKTWKPTKFVQNGIDVTTSVITANPCMANTSTFNSDKTWVENKAVGCSFAGTGTWSTSTTGGVNTLSTTYFTIVITSFDCNQVSGNVTINGTPYLVTVTKQ